MNLSLFVDQFETFAASAAPVVVTALWQGAILALGLKICVRLAPRISAAHRFILWSAGFFMLVSLPFLPQLLSAGSAGSVAATAGTGGPWMRLGLAWSLAIGTLWIAATLFRAADFVAHAFRLRRLWKSAMPVETRNCGRRQVEVCKTKILDRPSVIGFFAPRILIPEWVFDRLTTKELDQIVLHEAEHLRRGDDWTNLLQKLCLVLFPLNPALWWIERQICNAREMACDEGVIKITRAPRAYAACLTNLAECGLERRAAALSLGAWQCRSELAARVHRLLQRKRAMHPATSVALLAGLASSLFATSIEFARCPQLVAFVPAQTMESNVRTSAAWQSEPAEVLNASAAPTSKRVQSGFYAMQAKAVMPVAEKLAPAAARAKGKRFSPRNQSLNAKSIAPKSASPAQGLIVFTSWLEMEGAGVPPEADYDVAQRSDDGKDSQSDGRTMSRFSVTRLIFQVVPPSSNSPQPAATPMRNGWFVIQL